MTRRIFCKVLLVVVAIFGLLVISGVLLAQGRSEDAFERVREVQERNTDRLMAMDGVEGTAIGYNQNDRLAIKVFTAGPGVRGIPQMLDGVPVQVVVTGKFYALGKPGGTAPSAPKVLTATAVSSSQINLDWADNGESDLASYNVYRSNDTGSPYSQIASKVRSSDYSDTGLAAETIYYYVVTAVDRSKLESESSGEAFATTQAEGPPDATAPAAPTRLMVTDVSSNEINLDWDDNGESDLAYYNVYISLTGEAGSYSLIDSVGLSDYSDTGLAAETTYYYVVTAVDTSDNESANSLEVSATTQAGSVELPIGPRPAPIGVSTGHPLITAGTIGCRVTKDNNVYALSNNHVYANSNEAFLGDNVLQPGTHDGGIDSRDVIGTLAYWVIIDFDGGDNLVDAAIALSDTDQLGNATPLGGYGIPSSAPADAFIGQSVQKYGRTTGLTNGRVSEISATVNVSYGDDKVARFVNQIVILPNTGPGFSAGGDSGSLIVTDDEYNYYYPVGLLFAGGGRRTIANPIDAVLTAFPGISIDGK